VDSDLERFCDRVNHDALMSRVRRRVKDRRVVSLLPRGRKAGVVTLEGSGAPRLATLRLDELGKELEKRGPGFARSADEANI
jgi:retron-type reverse transcriptase